MSASLVGARVKARRESLGFDQEKVARLLGFRSRQTLSAIETGERNVKAEELVRLGEVLAVPLDYFTDPFLLVGEGAFSWRQKGVRPDRLDAYEQEAGRLIALHRALGGAPSLTRRALRLTERSSYEDAQAAGERFADEFGLGDTPALRLAEVMERDLGILVLMVDAEKGVSGAACRLPELDAVLINRGEVRGRRHYDLAHELFHVMTWATMPPKRIEGVEIGGKDRVEQLADNFAAAVLMPRAALERFGSWAQLEGDALADRLNEVADALAVTSQALKWRLVAIGSLRKVVAATADDRRLRNNGRAAAAQDLPPLFSRAFCERVASAIEEGRLSARRAAGILGVTVDDLEQVFAAHDVSFELGM
jgi:transcriptional regulator with XRE-family HTH domain/Zn-dependent peptidase ImmA (M78 family)